MTPRETNDGSAGVTAAVARLRELSSLIPRLGCEWEDRPTFAAPANEDAVAKLERMAGFSLPADLRTFFALTDAVVGMSVHNGYHIGGTETLAGIVESAAMPRRVPDGLAVPVGLDGGGNGFLLSATGRVWGWNHEIGSLSEIAESFGAFLDRVASDWNAYVADTRDWRYLV
jgi:hypothetical protein